ncbi:5009_t:CDS:2, partial [Diversispora eburnea]
NYKNKKTMYGNNFGTEENTSDNKEQEQLQMLLIIGVVGMGYYFFFFLPEQRSSTKKEITNAFNNNSPVVATDLDKSMIEAIETKKKDIEEKKFRSIQEAKDSAVKELEDSCNEKEKTQPAIKKIIEKYSRKINNSNGNDISTLLREAGELIVEERVKKQGLHWRRKKEKSSERDPTTRLDNNALFYGAPRTGKSVMAEKLAYEADMYPLIVIQGSSLTPRKIDYDAGIAPLGKFIFTLCDIDHTLTDDFNFRREENGEVRYILFIDEANQITTSTLISKSTELTFLKEYQINEAVYQPGRLSNPLDFSWTLGDFIRYAEEANITNDFPQH